MEKDNVVKLVRGPNPKNIVVMVTCPADNNVKFTLADISTRSSRVEIWQRKLSKPTKEKLDYYKRVGQRIQDMVHASSRDVVKSLFEGDPDRLASKMVKHAEGEMRLEASRRKANVLYESNGWAIYNPVPTVWMVTSPYGFFSAVASPENYVMIRMNAGPTANKICSNLRGALHLGIQDLFKAGKRPFALDTITKMLNEAGITAQVGDIIPPEVHAKLRDLVAELTRAARTGGIPGLKSKLKELALDEGAIF
jgi:hypothetical protein